MQSHAISTTRALVTSSSIQARRFRPLVEAPCLAMASPVASSLVLLITRPCIREVGALICPSANEDSRIYPPFAAVDIRSRAGRSFVRSSSAYIAMLETWAVQCSRGHNRLLRARGGYCR